MATVNTPGSSFQAEMENTTRSSAMASHIRGTVAGKTNRIIRPKSSALPGVMFLDRDQFSPYQHTLPGGLGNLFRTWFFADTMNAFLNIPRIRPRIIVADEQLGGKQNGGIIFTRSLRNLEDPSMRSIPVLIASEKDLKDIEVSIRTVQANGHVRLPYDIDVLRSTFSSMLAKYMKEEWTKLPVVARRVAESTDAIFNTLSGNPFDVPTPVDMERIEEASKSIQELIEQGDKDVILFLDSIRNHDNYTFVHSLRVSILLAFFAKELGLPPHMCRAIAGGGLTHDFGKLMIPLHILNKPWKHDPEEQRIMQGHVMSTMIYFADTPLSEATRTIASMHHEKLDGSGYPNGLKGKEINEVARMASIVDIFSALTDRRVYKGPMEAEPAFALMYEKMSAELDIKFLGLFKEIVLDKGIH